VKRSNPPASTIINDDLADKMRYLGPSANDPPLPPVIPNVDITSPSGHPHASLFYYYLFIYY
jgi:hypothetical protein